MASTLLNGLVAYWKCDEGSGSFYLYDSTGNVDLEVRNPNILEFPGKINNAIGVTSRVPNYFAQNTNAQNLTISSDITISFWIKLNKAIEYQTNSTAGIFNLDDNNLDRVYRNYGAYFIANEDKFCIESDFSSWGIVLTNASNYFSTTEYKHVICTRKKSSSTNDVKLYIDGVEINNNDIYKEQYNNNMETMSRRFYVLCLRTHSTGAEICLDEFGIWNREITQQEVKTLYNKGKGLSHPFDLEETNSHLVMTLGVNF